MKIFLLMLYKYDLVDQVATKWKPKSESRQDTATDSL